MKSTLIILLFILTSCGSLLISGNEVFTKMYVKDSIGCELKRAVVSTTRLNRIGVYKLSFYLEYDSVKIFIPVIEMDLDKHNYTGIGTDKKSYVVTYLIENKNTSIRVEGKDGVIEVSTMDICKQ